MSPVGVLHPRVQEFIDALSANGCTVQLLSDVDNEALPDAIATKNAKNFVLRLTPHPDAEALSESETFPRTNAQRQWDAWFAGTVVRAPTVQDAIEYINTAPEPEEPEEPEEEEPEEPDPEFEYIQVWGMPQTNRPRQRISPTNYGLCSTQSFEDTYTQFITYEKIAAVGTQDRIQWVEETGQDLIAVKLAPKVGDLQNNGNRASISATWEDKFSTYKKVSFAYQGDRTLDRFKVKFPTAGMPDVSRGTGSGYFGLFFQWHQEASSGGSPPVEFCFRQHPTTGVYWLFCRLDGIYHDSLGQFMPTPGTLGNGVIWAEEMVMDHWYQFEIEILHSTVQVGTTDPRRGGTGSIRIDVDGDEVYPETPKRTMADVYNFCDAALYQGRCINGSRYIYFCDWEHLVIPGPPIANVVGQPNITTNPLFPFYTPP